MRPTSPLIQDSHAVSARSVGPKALWYQDAVFYEVHVRAFRDSNSDGIGDFPGLTQKLAYLQALGVTTIWLLPFYPSPLKDDGYDIADYVSVHPDYGNLEDFKEFLHEAHRRGLHVVTELILNHTSDQHAWFQRARHAAPGSPERDFYVWSKHSDAYADARIIFKDFELSNWTWDPVARAYFWHRFYSHQPDLNYANPAVVKAMFEVVDFWLDLGVDGLRLDAVPYLAEEEGTSCENLPETHRILKELRRHIDEKYDDRMLLAEANQWPEEAAAYFGDGDECHMAFHFPLMPRLFLALRQEDSFPILDILSQTPDTPEGCQWALFLRNHDELTLEMVTEEERLFMWQAYAGDPGSRINLGIRRRLAPLLRNDRRRIELMNALLLSMPGTPVLYYGDEIGMGDNIYLGDRNGVRTPMQWGPGLNAGFSEANPQQLYLPLIVDPEYHHFAVQVDAHEHNPSSLLNWMRRILAIRKRYTALGRGTFEFLETDKIQVLAYERQHEAETLVMVANLSRFAQHFTVDLTEHAGKTPFDVFGRTPFPPIGLKPYPLSLGPHGFIWFSLETAPEDALRGDVRGYEAPLITLQSSSPEFLFGAGRGQLEQILPAFLRRQRWFGGEGKAFLGCRLESAIALPLARGAPSVYLATVRANFDRGDPDRYLLPLSVGADAEHATPEQDETVIARLASTGAPGRIVALRDASYDPRFIKSMLRLLLDTERAGALPESLAVLEMPALESLRGFDLETAEVNPADPTQKNIVADVGGQAVVKLFRRLQEGVSPDLELTRYLTARGFPNAPTVLGAVEQVGPKHESITLAVVQEFVAHHGTGWDQAVGEFAAFLARMRTTATELPPVSLSVQAISRAGRRRAPAPVRALIGGYLDDMAVLGIRVGEMHRALAAAVDQPGLAPERFTGFYQRSLYQRFRSLTNRTLNRLESKRALLPSHVSEQVTELLAHREAALDQFEVLRQRPLEALRIRCHGNLHLTNVLCMPDDDFMIIDFEGEPTLPLYERRLKASPLTDVVSLMRSIFNVPQAHLLSRATEAEPAERSPRLVAAMRYWKFWVAVEFLQAYRSAARKGRLLSRPADAEALLGVLMTARTVYELAYEQTHRPEWVTIPLDDLLEILRGPAEG